MARVAQALVPAPAQRQPWIQAWALAQVWVLAWTRPVWDKAAAPALLMEAQAQVQVPALQVVQELVRALPVVLAQVLQVALVQVLALRVEQVQEPQVVQVRVLRVVAAQVLQVAATLVQAVALQGQAPVPAILVQAAHGLVVVACNNNRATNARFYKAGFSHDSKGLLILFGKRIQHFPIGIRKPFAAI